MPADLLIRVENVSKKFCKDFKRSLWYGVNDFACEVFGKIKDDPTLRSGEFWSVKNVSFTVKRGECLGLIGPNGAGKTTILRMLNGLIRPDKGSITIVGRIGALISVGAGFNPLLTGRENIYANGILLGLSKKDVDFKFDEIVQFSGLEEFIDMPVQNYSSGMQVRLGFSVATRLETDILILDEILAVGDIEFRSKCYSYLSESMSTKAVIFVSHSMPQIGRMASNCLILHKGCVEFHGETNIAIQTYYNLYSNNEKIVHTGSGKLKLQKFIIQDGNDRNVDVTNPVKFGQQIIFKFIIKRFEYEICKAHISIVIFDMNDNICSECTTSFQDKIITLDKESVEFKATIYRLPLTQGRYRVSVVLRSQNEQEVYDWHHRAYEFSVVSENQGGASVQLLANWSF